MFMAFFPWQTERDRKTAKAKRQKDRQTERKNKRQKDRKTKIQRETKTEKQHTFTFNVTFKIYAKLWHILTANSERE